MITEVTNSIKAALYQRVSSPLYGTYIFSWSLYNWSALINLAFGSDKINSRIEIFKQSLYDSDGKFFISSITAPLFMTVAILVLQPIIQRYLYIYTEWNRSEGLKKRDKFSSETMLTLEQSNELRASVQKIQQFHQEILKNKESEIDEYKRQINLKEIANDRISKQNTDLIEARAFAESELSNKSHEYSNLETSINIINDKYKRLSTILSTQRKRQISLRDRLTPKDIYANTNFLISLKTLANVDDGFSVNEYSTSLKKLLSISTDEIWQSTCFQMLIDGFGKCWSFNMADSYFEHLIKPYLNNLNNELLKSL